MNHLPVPAHPDDTSEPESLLAGLRTGAWLDAQHFAPLNYHVPGILPEGSVLLVGPPKAGKSWLVLNLALAISAGGRALGRLQVEQRPVLYLALEDGDRRLQDRCRTLLSGAPIPHLFQYMTTVRPGTVIATVDEWLSIYGNDAPLIILDTLGKVMPPALAGESAYQRDYRIGSALKRLVDAYPGATMLTNHHDRKATSDDFVDSVSGTHGLAGAADTIIVLARDRQSPEGLLKVTGRDVAENEYAVTLSDGSAWSVDGDTLEEAAYRAVQRRAQAGVGGRTAEIIDFVASRPEGVRASDVEDKFGADTRRYLARLAEDGKLYRPKRGVYALPTTVSQASHVPNDDLTLGHWDSGDTPLGVDG